MLALVNAISALLESGGAPLSAPAPVPVPGQEALACALAALEGVQFAAAWQSPRTVPAHPHRRPPPPPRSHH